MSDQPRNYDRRMPENAPEGESAVTAELPGMMPIPVVVITAEPLTQCSYFTVVIPASSGTVPQTVTLLNQDPDRLHAYISAIDQPVVISTELSEAQSPANIGAAVPAGAFVQTGWSPVIRHQQPVYAANTSSSASTRVSVVVERKAPAA
jgi:hypothetical protein